jgi:hypothetical protein
MAFASDDESVGRSTYENLVRLTFLCGRGLEPEELTRRFMSAMRPSIPATGAWLFQGGRLIAGDADRGQRVPAPPRTLPPGLIPKVDHEGMITAPVLPEMVLVCRLASGSEQRAADVICLFARVIALAWQAEQVARNEPWDDDYLAAKADFKRRWIRSLLRRHNNVVSAAARAAGLSRGTFYAMMDQVGARDPSVSDGTESASDLPKAEIEAPVTAPGSPVSPSTGTVRARRT